MTSRDLASARRVPAFAPDTGARVAVVETLRLGDGRGLCVRRWPGVGDPLVILHGLLDSSEGWNELCERLPSPCIAFDLPGFGYSDPPTCGSIAGYARDVAQGLTMLGIERFNLLGHSLGGAIATWLAELMPAQVGALVLLAPAGFGRIHLAELISIPGIRNIVQAALPSALTSPAAVTVAYMTMVTNGAAPDQGIVDRVVRRGGNLAEGAREATRAVVNAGRSRRAFHRRTVAYDGPVSAVWGDRDLLVPPAHREGVKAALPQARIEVWHGMGHHPVRERFDELVALVQEVTVTNDSVRRLTASLPPAEAA
jgi:pimeloyl-ACP methyl ester carboxylesterase